MNPTLRLGLLGLAVALSACSSLESDKINYKSASVGSSLEVPPDLTQLSTDSRYVIPGQASSASAYEAGRARHAKAGINTAPNQIGDVRIEREGTTRWLVVARAPNQLWEPVRDFWLEHGFILTLDQPQIGIMETDWAENRAKIPEDVIRRTIGKIFDSLYSTGERDKFRTRLERRADGGTDITITHRGMQEVYTNAQKDNTIWQPRPEDPELEAEFLRRLMVKLGVSEEQAKAAIAAAPAAPAAAARLVNANGAQLIELQDGFDHAWRRVGLSLDRTGFTVEDRDRSQGTYFVRYVTPTEKKEPGFFSRLFGASANAAPPEKYRIVVQSNGGLSRISVLQADGQAESSANVERILRILVDDLK